MRLFLSAAVLLVSGSSALAGSEWLESRRLGAAEIRELCGRVGDVRPLARMQMITAGDARWRRLSRQELVIESAVMGLPPLDPDRCYLVARAGQGDDGVRRAFEVRDFAANPARVSVLLVGRHYELPDRLY